MIIITLNGKGINAACASYSGRGMQGLRLSFLYSLFPNVKSGALLYGHCRETHVGSAIFHCRAATDHLPSSLGVSASPAARMALGCSKSRLRRKLAGFKGMYFFNT